MAQTAKLLSQKCIKVNNSFSAWQKVYIPKASLKTHLPQQNCS